MSFVKVHEQLLDSSVWDTDLHVRVLWVTCLVLADREGHFTITRAALARRANLTREQVDDALAVLCGPDADSTTPDHDGRRLIEEAPNVWTVVNYTKHRQLRDEDERREQTRRRVAAWRERQRDGVTDCNAHVTHVTRCNPIAEAEADTEAEYEQPSAATSSDKPTTRREEDEVVHLVQEFWNEHGLKPGCSKIADRRRQSILARWRQHGWEAVAQVLKSRATSNWLRFEAFGGRGADIDWVFRPNNFLKILDGKYNDD